MKFHIRIGGRVRGPFQIDELVVLPDFSPHTLVCPEGKDLANRRNWVFARAHPAILCAIENRPKAASSEEKAALLAELGTIAKAPAPDAPKAPKAGPEGSGGGAKFYAGVIAAGVAAAALLSVLRGSAPPAAVPPSAARPTKPEQRAAALALPSCLGEARQDMTSGAYWRLEGGIKKLAVPLSPGQGGGEALFAVDDSGRSLKPLNEDAARVMDFRKSCGRDVSTGRAR
jgi:hypothetical protein